jgi:hypothetical protein
MKVGLGEDLIAIPPECAGMTLVDLVADGVLPSRSRPTDDLPKGLRTCNGNPQELQIPEPQPIAWRVVRSLFLLATLVLIACGATRASYGYRVTVLLVDAIVALLFVPLILVLLLGGTRVEFSDESITFNATLGRRKIRRIRTLRFDDIHEIIVHNPERTKWMLWLYDINGTQFELPPVCARWLAERIYAGICERSHQVDRVDVGDDFGGDIRG